MNQSEIELLAKISVLEILVETQYLNLLLGKKEEQADKIIAGLSHLGEDLEIGAECDPKVAATDGMALAQLTNQGLKLFAENVCAKLAVVRAARSGKGQ